MKKFKIIHLLQSNKFSGAENIVCQIMNMFKGNDRFDMTYVCPAGPISKVLDSMDLNYIELKNFSRKEIARAVKEIDPDVIHAHDFNASVKASIYKKKIIISHLHNNPLWLSKLDIKTVVYALCIHRFYSIIGVSNSIKDEFRYKHLIKEKFVMLPNTVDAKKVIKAGNEINENEIDILYVGRMSEPKNPLAIISIIEKLKESYSKKLRVMMIGDGPLFREVQLKIRDKNLSDVIEMKGFVSNPYKYMNSAKVLIMPSIWEGFGLVSVESMLLKTPVVAYNVGGLKEIIDDGNGFLCDSENELVESLEQLLNSEILRKKMGENAAISAKKFSNTRRYKEVLEDIYTCAVFK
ncbi:glycosyltransferase [Enterococcus mundtii]|nr:glycosyltransferase [Enterococcus mundtii]